MASSRTAAGTPSRLPIHSGCSATTRCRDAGFDPGRPMETSYFLGRERLVPTGESRMARWRKKIFVVMSRNAQSAGAFFGLPANRVVELGAVIEF